MTVETIIIDGKAIAAGLRGEVAAEVAARKIKPGLAVVLVGDDAASKVYVGAKIRACQEVGIRSLERRLPPDVSEAALLAEVAALNRDETVNGILVQLPLPRHIRESAIINAIDPAKDVDGFHPVNVGRLWSGDTQSLTPCTPLGCLLLLEATLGDISGKHAVVLGRSSIVGKPVAALLLRASCTVTVAHSRTQAPEEEVRRADIVIAAVGKPGLVRGSWIKPGACVLDVGINRVGGKLVGDVAFDECLGIAGAITPVPGGVGPMTIACLLKNTLTAFGCK